MAIRRVSEKLQSHFIDNIGFDNNSDIVIQTDLFEVTIAKSHSISQNLKGLYDLVNFDKGDFLTITQGIHQVTIISNKRHKNNILTLLKREKTIKEINNLSSVAIRIPEDSINTVGLFFIVTRALAWENIPIVEIVSTFTELIFILKENNVISAYNAINNLLKK